MYLVFYIKIHGLNQLNYKSFMNGSISMLHQGNVRTEKKRIGEFKIHNIVVPDGLS